MHWLLARRVRPSSDSVMQLWGVKLRRLMTIRCHLKIPRIILTVGINLGLALRTRSLERGSICWNMVKYCMSSE